MTEVKDNPEPQDGPGEMKVSIGRRWSRRAAIGSGVVLAGYLVFPLGVRVWKRFWLHSDAPRIAFSPNDTWLENLHVNEAYQVSFTLAQGELVEIQPPDTGANRSRIAAWLGNNRIDGVLLAGGGDVGPRLYGGDPKKAADVNRARDDFELALIEEASSHNLPILGICRGCQLLNVARGGTLRDLRSSPDLKAKHFNTSGHKADLAKGSRLAAIMDTRHLDKAQSYHYQAVDQLGDGLRVSATGPGGVVEAIEGSSGAWVMAVQWHPELSVSDARQNALLKAFVEAAAKER